MKAVPFARDASGGRHLLVVGRPEPSVDVDGLDVLCSFATWGQQEYKLKGFNS